MRFTFFLREIVDQYIRDNFKHLQDALDLEPTLKCNFKFFSITTSVAVTNLTYAHNLKYQPQDVLLLSASNGATVTFNYDKFDKTNIVFTASAATTFRCLVGKYSEGVLR